MAVYEETYEQQWVSTDVVDDNCTYYLQMCLSAGMGLGSASRRKLSFKNVSNVVVQLLHSIKFNVDVPFSNMAASPQELKANAARKVQNVWQTRERTKQFTEQFLLHN